MIFYIRSLRRLRSNKYILNKMSPENQTILTSNFQYLRYLYQRDRENELCKVVQFILL